MPEAPPPKARPHPARRDLPAGSGPASAPPAARPAAGSGPGAGAGASPGYVDLQVASNFSFLRGASHPDELVTRAAALGHAAVAITDVNSLAGIVRAHVAARQAGLPLVVGCCLELREEGEAPPPGALLDAADAPAPLDPPSAPSACRVLVYPTDRASYGRLCRLLTLGKRRAPKGQCHLWLHDLVQHQQGLLAAVLPPEGPDPPDDRFVQTLAGLREVFDADRLSLAAGRRYGPDDAGELRRLALLAEHTRIPLLAVNDIHYHVPGRRPLQDVLTCIRHGCTLDEAGFRLFPHGQRHLKPPAEMERLFRAYPQAVARTVELARRAAGFSLDQLRYEYPDEVCPAGQSPMRHLRELTWAGAAERYPRGLPARVRAQIEHEFTLIAELNYAPYFLTVHDLVGYARSRGILCQGRGAAANSAVCYCLGVTAVDPDRIDVLFERFVSRERNEPPDIDIDFEHERREEVIQYLYRKYGRARAALTAEVISYRGRSALREVGKALGLSLDCVDRLAKGLDWWDHDGPDAAALGALGLNPEDPLLRHLLALSREIQGFPRHLSQHVGGFVITRGPLCEMVPLENAAMPQRTVIEWDKDDIDALGILKVDVLGLGMLTCLRKAFDLLGQSPAAAAGSPCPSLSLACIPPEDPAVYDMICAADTLGVFQIESRAQMSMLPRLKPRCFYDLVIEVAIVRPGPIQGDMVHPYLRRRNGQEAVSYPDERVQAVLGKTLGVPLFQEQAMRLSIVAAGFTPGEADQLRRAIAAWKSKQKVLFEFGRKIVEGMTRHGYERAFAERCFEQIKGFSEYGFPESHAASFALLVYASAWLKKYHPAPFAAALINSQPMGFYAPAQIVRDAVEHGVEVRPIDVNHSRWDCTLEGPGERTSRQALRPAGQAAVPGAATVEVGSSALGGGFPAARTPSAESSHPALRLGLRLVRGLTEIDAQAIAAAAARHGPFASVEALRHAGGVSVDCLRRLAGADAFGSMGLDRQHALWQIRQLRDQALPLWDANAPSPAATTLNGGAADRGQGLPTVPELVKVTQDYAAAGLTLRRHPMAFLRPGLERLGVSPARAMQDAQGWPAGRRLGLAGVVLVRQRPGSAAGVIFITLEDETGIANLIVRPTVFQRCRAAVKHARVLLARGRVERDGQVAHLLAEHLEDLDHSMRGLLATSRDFH